jgi:hypothetical protein
MAESYFLPWLCDKLGNIFENVTGAKIVHAQRQKSEWCLYRISIQIDVCISLNYRLIIGTCFAFIFCVRWPLWHDDVAVERPLHLFAATLLISLLNRERVDKVIKCLLLIMREELQYKETCKLTETIFINTLRTWYDIPPQY